MTGVDEHTAQPDTMIGTASETTAANPTVTTVVETTIDPPMETPANARRDATRLRHILFHDSVIDADNCITELEKDFQTLTIRRVHFVRRFGYRTVQKEPYQNLSHTGRT